MASTNHILAALDKLAAADPDEINAVLDELEQNDPGIRHRLQASLSYMADGIAQRPFWGAVLKGYRPAGGGV